MGVLVMVLGKSGAGKSTSLRNFEAGEIGIFNVAGKPLPFRKRLPKADRCGYRDIAATLAKNDLRAYAVDDSTYLMQFDNFARANDSGYQKFTDIAVSFERLLEAAMATDENTVVYFLHHPDEDERGNVRPKSVGKMLNEKLCIEGLFPSSSAARCATASTCSASSRTSAASRRRPWACSRKTFSRTT